MGTIWIPGGSGGADTSVVTATAEDVLAPKVIVGPDGEPIDGTMVNNGAVSHSLPINGTYPIPEGYHDGNGEVSQSIPVQGGSTTTPGTVAKTIVAANRYVNGNIVVAGDPNLIPANIKKDAVIFGVRGIHSGYVSSPTDLYLRGNNIVGWKGGIQGGGSNYVVFDTGQITITGGDFSTASIAATFNMTGFTKLNIQYNNLKNLSSTTRGGNIILNRNGNTVQSITGIKDAPGIYTKSLDITAFQANALYGISFIEFCSPREPLAIYRIWLS